MAGRQDDEVSVTGLFEAADTRQSPVGAAEARSGEPTPVRVPVGGMTREAPVVRRAVGRGPVPPDPRKHRYDVTQGRSMARVSYGASKADRLDASLAGAMLDKIHALVGIERDPENVLLAFDKALFFEHAINGASLLQPGRGVLYVGDSEFELQPIKAFLGPDQRRFFRAYADDVANVLREVLADYDPYDPVSAERHGQVMQVAVARGLQKYPHLAHDSSDAGIALSVEERIALLQSKREVIASTENNVDKPVPRVGSGSVESRAKYDS